MAIKSNNRKKAVDFFSSGKSDDSVNVKGKTKGGSATAKFDPLARVKHSDDDDDDDDDNEEDDNDDEDDEDQNKLNSLSFSKFESEDEENQPDEDSEEELSKGTEKPGKLKRDVFADEDDEEEEEDNKEDDLEEDDELEEQTPTESSRSKEAKLKARQKSAEAAEKRSKKSGLVYISRVPEFLTPGGMRHILSKYGPVDRIFLVPEPASVREQRMAHGGSKQRMYTEGWAEFVRKKDAKLCASVLNGRGSTIGGKNRRGRFYDTVMAVRYLHKFKWNDLAEQMVVEKEARVEKLRKEIGIANEENRLFAHGVAMAKAMKRNSKTAEGEPSGNTEMLRTFDQREAHTKRARKAPEDGSERLETPGKRRKDGGAVGGSKVSRDILAQIM